MNFKAAVLEKKNTVNIIKLKRSTILKKEQIFCKDSLQFSFLYPVTRD